MPPRIARLVPVAAAGGALAALACGCSRGIHYHLTDTEGRRFDAVCTPETGCTLTQTDGPKRTDGPARVILNAPGRLVAACDVRDKSETPESPAECRALVCTGDDACPPAPGVPTSTCIAGTCADPTRETSTPDAVILCLAGTGFGRATPKQIERYALGLNCGTPCNIPAMCRVAGK